MEEHTRPKTVKISVWKVLTTLFAILLLVAVLTKGFTTFTASSPQKTAENTVKFINDNLLQPGMQATLVSVKEEKGLVKATLSLSGNPLDIYITKDGTLLMPQVIDMTKKVPPQGATPTSTTPVAVNVANAPMQGSKDAPVTILEFSDFQCPFCGKFYKETLSQLEDTYVKTGKVKLYFRNYPLDTTCNPSMSQQLHPFACKAAEAAACADAQGKFWEYHNTLFENQDALTIADLKKYNLALQNIKISENIRKLFINRD